MDGVAEVVEGRAWRDQCFLVRGQCLGGTHGHDFVVVAGRLAEAPMVIDDEPDLRTLYELTLVRDNGAAYRMLFLVGTGSPRARVSGAPGANPFPTPTPTPNAPR